MSAGNSYFKEKNIEKLIKFSSERFEKVLITSPSKPAEHNFLSRGYPKKKAKRKATLNANLLINRAKRIIKDNVSEKDKEKIKIISWTPKLENNKFYKEEYSKLKTLYATNKKFRRAVNKKTKKVFSKKEKYNLKIAINYLIEELSFVLASPKMYGIKNITYIYHQKWPIYKKLIKGKYSNNKRTNLKFLLKKF